MDKMINSGNLKIARESRGYSQRDLSDITKISRQSIHKYESGSINPSSENILTIANALEFPLDYFYIDSIDIKNDSATFFRKKKQTPKKVCNMQYHHFNFGYSIYNYFLQYIDFPVTRLLKGYIDNLIEIDETYIEQMALNLRDLWGLGIHPIDNLFNVIEANGIVILDSIISDEKLDASSRWINNHPFILLTDKDESFYRRRFNVAHELGHLILHSFINDISELDREEYDLLEKQANYFASVFLMPNDAFIESVRSIDINYLIQLKKYWKVSLQSIIYKLKDLKLISENQYLYLQRQISRNKWRKIEPLDQSTKKEKTQLLSKAYNLLIENFVITSNDLYYDLCLPKNIVNHFLNLNEDIERIEPIIKLVR